MTKPNAFTAPAKIDQAWVKAINKERKVSEHNAKTARLSPYGKTRTIDFMTPKSDIKKA